MPSQSVAVLGICHLTRYATLQMRVFFYSPPKFSERREQKKRKREIARLNGEVMWYVRELAQNMM
jgi:hypothetical protein